MPTLWEGTHTHKAFFFLQASFSLWIISLNILAHLSKKAASALTDNKEEEERVIERGERVRAEMPTTVVPVISILGHSEILIYLFNSVSHFPFTRSRAFHISLCDGMYPLFPPGD